MKKPCFFNHSVADALPRRVFNHAMDDAAPTIEKVIGGKVFFDDENGVAAKLGVVKYPGRALGSTHREDIIQLPNSIRGHWDWISCHYKRAGIEHSGNVIWEEKVSVMSEYPEYEPSVFLFGERAHSARPDEKWFEIVKMTNSKNSFLSICENMGIPTPKTWKFNCKSEILDFEKFPYPCYLKIAESVSGLGVMRCEDIEQLKKEISSINENVAIQVQENLNAITFLNLQYRVNRGLERVLATEQVLKGNCHNGNMYPTCHQPWGITDPIAIFMAKNGMKGYFAFDVAVCVENGKFVYRVIECNPRYNGSSYPTNIATKIGARAWIAKKICTTKKSFSSIDLGELEFSSKTGNGLIVVNWGCIEENELGVLFVANSVNEQKDIEEKLMLMV